MHAMESPAIYHLMSGRCGRPAGRTSVTSQTHAEQVENQEEEEEVVKQG